MSIRLLDRPPASPEPPRLRPRRPAGFYAAVGVLVALIGGGLYAVIDLQLNLATILDGVGNAGSFLSRTLPLDFSDPGELIELCLQTLAMVVCATGLAVVLSVPVAVLAAANTSPNRPTRMFGRALIVLARAVPDLVLALIFVRVFGLGAIVGILAMGLHSVGMLGKLFADAIEQIDEGPRDAIRATGAKRLAELTSGVLPQILPAIIAGSLHRFDINVRISVILGFVGVGGIGFELSSRLSTLQYERGMAIALVIFALCVLTEIVSALIRRAVLGELGGAENARGNRRNRRNLGDRLLDRLPTTRRAPVASPASPVRISPPWDRHRIRVFGYAAVGGLILIASIWGSGLRPGQILESLPQLYDVLGQFLPPTFGSIAGELWSALLDTIVIALAATLIGVTLSIPLGALAARNVAPNPTVRRIARLILVCVRGIPELILAVIFVVMTGLGPQAGALALGIGGVGLLGKLLADSIEETDPRPEEAVRASGASRWQVFVSATVPQAAPAYVAHVLYLLDVNIRHATLLGIVGAGGIGFWLSDAARTMNFPVVTTVILMVFGVVLLVELLAMWLRRRVR